jgi:hypothetical protein
LGIFGKVYVHTRLEFPSSYIHVHYSNESIIYLSAESS